MDTLGNSLSMLTNPAIILFLVQGVAFTLIISVVAVLVSILFGSVLALLRNYCTGPRTKILKWAATVYIELFRNTPLLFWEIVRGGLNSVARGQIEAGQSQGFHMVQVMVYIVLPQAFRTIIPTLLSQVITTIKDSSFLANVAVIELMARTKQILSAANRYNGTNSINVSDVFVLFGTAALIYFIINFALSLTVRGMQRKRSSQNVVKKVEV